MTLFAKNESLGGPSEYSLLKKQGYALSFGGGHNIVCSVARYVIYLGGEAFEQC